MRYGIQWNIMASDIKYLSFTRFMHGGKGLSTIR